jgi:hypothetical protein
LIGGFESEKLVFVIRAFYYQRVYLPGTDRVDRIGGFFQL